MVKTVCNGFELHHKKNFVGKLTFSDFTEYVKAKSKN